MRILGTRLTGLPELERAAELLPPLELLTGLRLRPVGVAKGGADKIDVREGAEAARDEIFGR